METNERILISQNDVLLEQIKGDIRYFKAPFKKLAAAYNELQLGEISPEVFEEIKAGQAIKSVRKYEAGLEKSLDQTQVFNPTLRANLLAGTGEVSGAFLRAAKEFMATEFKPTGYGRQDHQVLSVGCVSLDEDGDLIISKENEEEILEGHCRYYLETADQKEIYAISEALCEQYNKLMVLNKRMQLELNTYIGFGICNGLVSYDASGAKPAVDKVIGLSQWAARRAKYNM